MTLENITLTRQYRSRSIRGVQQPDCWSAVIRDNEGGFCGGICVEEGTCVIEGAVTCNKAENGGGIAVRGASVIGILGIVTANAAAGSGGGILLDGNGAEITGEVSENTAESGGGVYLGKDARMVMRNTVQIRGNSAVRGGDVFINDPDSNFTLEGGVISGNTAAAFSAALRTLLFKTAAR